MICFPNGKINLGLKVRSKRQDGFHNIESIFYPIPLCDSLEFIQSGSNTSLRVTGNNIKSGMEDENIILRALKLISENYEIPPLKIHLHKNIPDGAGLGGGSSDATFMLMLLNNCFALNISHEGLYEYALELGSDCPFFLWNKPALVTGRGEKISPLDFDLKGYYLVIVTPADRISTAEAFSKIKTNDDPFPLEKIIQKKTSKWKDLIHNDFETSLGTEHSIVNVVKQQLYKDGAVFCSMSGSGSSVFGLFEQKYKNDFLWKDSFFCQYKL